MLYSIVIRLSPQDANVPPSMTNGYHAYALFLSIMRQADSKLARQLHDGDGPKPFTIALHRARPPRPPLRASFRAEAGADRSPRSEAPTRSENTLWLRLTIMADDVFTTVLNWAVGRAGDARLSLDNTPLQLEEIVTTPHAAPGVDCTTFESIYEKAGNERHIALSFLSPTTFRSGGRRNILLPEPQLVFGSYLARWQKFSPVKLDNAVGNAMTSGALLARYRLQTGMLDFGSYQETGFTGTCSFELDSRLPDERVRALNALADFAFYAGTGAKTTMGMGQTRRIDARPLPGRAGGHPPQGG